MPQSEGLFVDLQRRWSRMPPSNRLWLTCLIALTLIIVAGSISYERRPSDELLLGGKTFTARELMALRGAFSKSGLGDYEIIDGCVRISRENRSEYVAALVDAQIVPISAGSRPAVGGSIFESHGQRALRERGLLEQDLSECVRRFADIEDASVRIDEAIVGQGFHRENRVTSMVVLQPTSVPLTSERIRSIRKLIASAKVELHEQDVTVTDLATGRCFGGESTARFDYRRTDDFALHKQEQERQWSEKFQGALSFIPGVRVTTNVDLRSNDNALSTAESGATRPDTLSVRDVSVSVSVPNSYYQSVWQKHRSDASHSLKGRPEDATIAAIEHETRQRVIETLRPLCPSIPFDNPAVNIPGRGESGSQGNEPHPRISVVSFPDVPALADGSPPVNAGGFADWFRSNFVWALLALLTATVLGFYAIHGLSKELRKLWIARHRSAQGLRVVRDSEERRGHETVPREDGTASDSVVPFSQKRPAAATVVGAVSSADEDVDDSVVVGVEYSPVEESTDATDEIFSEGPSAVHDGLTQIVRDNPDAAAEMLKRWIDKAG